MFYNERLLIYKFQVIPLLVGGGFWRWSVLRFLIPAWGLKIGVVPSTTRVVLTTVQHQHADCDLHVFTKWRILCFRWNLL